MSPFVLDRNVPLIGLPRGGQIGANADEQEGVGTSGSAGASAGKVRRSGGRALWADAGDRTLGVGGRAEDSCRNAAALDASGRVVEPGAKTAATPFAARAQRAFWGDGADGRQLPCLAGRAGTTGLLDRFGG